MLTFFHFLFFRLLHALSLLISSFELTSSATNTLCRKHFLFKINQNYLIKRKEKTYKNICLLIHDNNNNNYDDDNDDDDDGYDGKTDDGDDNNIFFNI